jgi:hypothetical protein
MNWSTRSISGSGLQRRTDIITDGVFLLPYVLNIEKQISQRHPGVCQLGQM